MMVNPRHDDSPDGTLALRSRVKGHGWDLTVDLDMPSIRRVIDYVSDKYEFEVLERRDGRWETIDPEAMP